MRNILVIKLSALGDFVLSIGAMQAIRAHHGADRITLLTTAPFARLAQASGCFDRVWIDRRPPLTRPLAWLRLARKLRQAKFDRVYDLQRAQRTGWYFHLAGRPKWFGKVAGCSHRYLPPAGKTLHATEREAAQLALAGIDRIAPPDLSFIDSDVGRFALPRDYALLMPGCAPHRPGKRWPAESYGELALALSARGIAPVLIGGPAERQEMAIIAEACPGAKNLCGETELFDLAPLARGARVAVGNDTGPTHLIAAAGCPTVVLFSQDSHPVTSRPPWSWVRVLREARLTDLPVAAVAGAAAGIERRPRD